MNNHPACEFGHESHVKKIVDTELGPMIVYDWDMYKDLDSGQCAGRDDVSRTLANQGWWERAETNLIKSILEEGDRRCYVLDVGSNVGWYSRMASQYGYKVISYDFIQESLDMLDLNASQAKKVNIWFDENSGQITDIPEPEYIRLLKIDIEGNDRYAIDYFEPILDRVHNIVIEVSPVFNESYPEMLKKIKSHGFEIMELNGRPFDFDFNFGQRDLWCRKFV